LAAVEVKYGNSDFDRKHYALLAIMSIYGIEMLGDNVRECQRRLLETVASYLQVGYADEICLAAKFVLTQNVLHGDAISMTNLNQHPIAFAEWGYLGKGKFQRRDFSFDVLTGASAFSAEGSLFADLGKHEIFLPIRTYERVTIRDLAKFGQGIEQ